MGIPLLFILGMVMAIPPWVIILNPENLKLKLLCVFVQLIGLSFIIINLINLLYA